MGKRLSGSNYPKIQHLKGSKMIDQEDKLIGEAAEMNMVVKTRLLHDMVIVTEKLDGCNVGVYRDNSNLYPVSRRGWDVNTSPHSFLQIFELYVEKKKDQFMTLLKDGERVCGEWLYKTHTIKYNLPHDPFVVFDIIQGSTRLPYFMMRERVHNTCFNTAGLVHAGVSIKPLVAISMLGKGFHGAITEPEGVIYRYESKNKFICSAKFVSNTDVGNSELFKRNIENDLLLNQCKKW